MSWQVRFSRYMRLFPRTQDVCAIGGAMETVSVSVLVECSVVARVNHDLSQAPAAAKASCLPHLLSAAAHFTGSAWLQLQLREYLSRLTLTLRT